MFFAWERCFLRISERSIADFFVLTDTSFIHPFIKTCSERKRQKASLGISGKITYELK